MAFGDEVFPQKFGEYVLLERIAIGGMAEIFRAQALQQTQKEICIKRILPHYSEDDAFVKMFIDEATIAAKLDQKNIVKIYDFDIIDDTYYIAMELVYGRDLKQTLEAAAKRAVRLTAAQVAYVSAELSGALQYAHTRTVDGKALNIIHRDVSPHNVLLGFNNDIKLTDFGIAKAASRLTTTRAGTVKGKCAYMSPEQARGRDLDHRSDIFSVGILMHEMLTGRRLFSGESDFDILTKVLKEPIQPPTRINPDVPPEIERICLKALARERNRRYPSCEDLQHDLEQWMRANDVSRANVGLDRFLPSLFGVSDVPLDEAQPGPAHSGSRPTLDPSADLPSSGGPPVSNMATQLFDREALKSGDLEVLEPSHAAPKSTIPMESVSAPRNPAPPAGPNERTGPQPVGGVGGVQEMTPRLIVPAPASAPADINHDDKTAVLNIAEYEAKMASNKPPVRAPMAEPTRQPPAAPQKKRGLGFIMLVGALLLLVFGGCALTGVGAYVATQTDLLAAYLPEDSGHADKGSVGLADLDGDDGDAPPEPPVVAGNDDDTEPVGADDDDKGRDADLADDRGPDGGQEVDAEATETPTIKIVSEPPGAKVYYAGELRPGLTPMDVTGFEVGANLKFRIVLEGYQDSVVGLRVADRDNLITVELAKKDESAESPAIITPIPAKREYTPEQIEAARKRREEQKKRAQANKGTGTATINAYPFAEVSVDGRKVGRTPIRNLKLTTGHHVVVLTNPDLKKTKRKRITVKKDEAITVFHNFK